jgi:hypothetical protein
MLEEEQVLIAWFRNSYECSRCGENWQDEWSCMCNDRCPNCNLETSPSESDDLSEPPSETDFEGVAELKLHKSPLWGGMNAEARQAAIRTAALSVSIYEAKEFGERQLEKWGGPHR